MADIVVVAARTSEPSVWYDNWFAPAGVQYRFSNDTPIEGGDDGSVGTVSYDNFIETLVDLITDLLSTMLETALKTPDQIRQNETRIATQFDPDQVAAISSYATNDGHHGQMWNMRDGSIYWDTNNNGQADYHTKYEMDGHLYGDDGTGWAIIK